ncbi:restriction endonuclease subunit S [Undibacterium sp. TS12]|uniref:restriction endonuclease subunit S n=1 Tax=Undibacterium sp. TS12 TaxID=2908202 RepID=UPI001F4CE362|nr:restriction endonuclease subunit S [Undibacterium sp. TS12]MCH8621003.1 restriction endonuclease subunit S [Undibacterium sp. TS12]
MSDFKEVFIGKQLKLTSGFPFASSQFSNEGTPLIRIRDILESSTETYFQGYIPSGYLIKKGDILVGMDGDFHVVKWLGVDALLNQRVLKVEVPNESILTLDYLFHWLGPFIKKVNDVTSATTVKHLSTKDLIKAVAYIPKVSAQRKIASILTAIDSAIDKTEVLISKYQQIKTGLMHDLFTRGVLPNGQLRPPRSEAPQLYQKTAIGWIPNEWDVKGLASKGRSSTSWLRTGPFGSALKGEHWRTHGHPVITIGALGAGVFTYDELFFVDDKDAARLIDFQLKPGDVVFSRVADVGRSVVVREDQAGWIMSSNLMRIAIDESLARADFLQMMLADDTRIKAQIRAHVNSGGRDVANSEVLSQLFFAWPNIKEQDRIIELSNQANCRLQSEQKKAMKLRLKKLGLMQDLLTGKVPVKVDEPELETST